MDSFTQQLDGLIHNRRSIKPENFNSIPVEDAIVQQMLENARWAPTHARTEPWHFTVFTANGLRKFADFQSFQIRV